LSYEDDKHNKRMEIAAEPVKGATPPADTAALADGVFRKLGETNGDFYNAMHHTATPDNMPCLTLHEFETGPFAGGQRKLKNEYVASNLKYDRLQAKSAFRGLRIRRGSGTARALSNWPELRQ
jgi:phenylacetate-CoA ligase